MTYVVKTGDTLFTIAQKYNTTVEKLIALNNIQDPNMIMVGMVLIIEAEEPTPKPPLEAEWCPRLTLESRGNAVRKIQTLLKERGYDPGVIDGIYGARTRAAVVNFQRATGLNVTGIVNINVWRALGLTCKKPQVSYCPVIRPGARGSAVRFLQSLLKRLKFAPGPIDGIYGEDTRAAVIAFQINNNISPTGIVDEETWNELGVTCVPAYPDNGDAEIPEEDDEFNYVWKEIEGFRYILATDKKRYDSGERVKITFRKRNITDESVTLEYSSTQLFDFYISNEKGNEIWRWSEDKSFSPIVREIILAPGEAETIDIKWNQINKRGKLVNPQTFTLWGTNKAAGDSVALQFEVLKNNE